MDNLVLDGGHMPDAADLEDVGSEIYSMVVRYESVQTAENRLDELQAEQQSEQPSKQAIWVLYGVLGMAVGTLAWLWTKMF